VLDPESGRLIYCNAGHPPPLLLSACDCAVRRLSFTGPPLGMLEEGAWQTVAVTFDPGDTLVLYTDGVTDAQAADESPFDQARLLAAARAALGRPAEPLCDAVVAEVDAFVAGAPQGDDIALMVVRRAP
jgi:sigma-B regulation protein RsbU (phosphoserine phosphatase)